MSRPEKWQGAHMKTINALLVGVLLLAGTLFVNGLERGSAAQDAVALQKADGECRVGR